MAQPLSIERSDWTYLITTRTSGSRIWFVGNKELEERILGCLARYQEIHQVEIFAFVIMGNHYHLIARFPNQNRAPFMRDFNSAVARLVGRYVGEHGRRSVWARRYSYQILPTPEDVRHWFFYLALNPVSSGLVSKLQQYHSFNSFFDAARGKIREYRWLDWNAYFKRLRHNRRVSEAEFTRIYKLRFSRLPATLDLPQEAIKAALLSELETRRVALVQDRKDSGKGFLGQEKLSQQALGSKPFSTKNSKRTSFRPIVLSLCGKAKRATLAIYFSTLAAFKYSAVKFEAHLLEHVPFPSGTYPPPHIRCTS